MSEQVGLDMEPVQQGAAPNSPSPPQGDVCGVCFEPSDVRLTFRRGAGYEFAIDGQFCADCAEHATALINRAYEANKRWSA